MHVSSGSVIERMSSRRFGECLVALTCLIASLTPCATALAQDDVTSGEFTIRSAYTQELDGVYHVSAQIDYGLTETAIEALNNGVALTFELDIEVQRKRRWLPDKNEHQLLQRYELSFDSLTERYIVRSINSGEQNTYDTLASALRGLGNVDRLPVIDAALLNAERDYFIAIRTSLDVKSFRGPLRLLASLLNFGEWRLASGWHTWALNP